MLVPYLRSLFLHSTYISQHILRGSCISGGGSFQGEWLPWVLVAHTWWVSLSTRGRVYDSSSFACSVLGGVLPKGESFGDEWCEIWKISSLWQGERSVHSYSWVLHNVRGCILGLSGLSGLNFCLLLYRLCRAFVSFWRNRCFASAWLCWALPLSLRGHA